MSRSPLLGWPLTRLIIITVGLAILLRLVFESVKRSPPRSSTCVPDPYLTEERLGVLFNGMRDPSHPIMNRVDVNSFSDFNTDHSLARPRASIFAHLVNSVPPHSSFTTRHPLTLSRHAGPPELCTPDHGPVARPIRPASPARRPAGAARAADCGARAAAREADEAPQPPARRHRPRAGAGADKVQSTLAVDRWY